MPRRPSPYQACLTAAWLAVGLGLTSGCRCQDERADSSLPEAAWSSVQPFVVADASLTEPEYVNLGLPPMDRNWSSDDMNQAALRLRVLANDHPEQLPRSNSARSRSVLGRITSRDNWGVFEDSTLPALVRFPAAATGLQALNTIGKLYTDATNEKKTSGDDLAELNATRLFACNCVLRLMDEVRKTLQAGDGSERARLAALEPMRQSLGDLVIEILSGIANPRVFGLTARKRLIEACHEHLTAIVVQLTPQARAEILERLEQAAMNPRLGNLQPGLNQLRDQMRGVAAKQESRP